VLLFFEEGRRAVHRDPLSRDRGDDEAGHDPTIVQADPRTEDSSPLVLTQRRLGSGNDSRDASGDESALPAISVLLRALPPEAKVQVLVEVRHLAARLELPAHPGATVHWYQLEAGSRTGDSLAVAVTGARLVSCQVVHTNNSVFREFSLV